MTRKIYSRSLGCKVNLADSAQVVAMLGGDTEVVKDPALADVAVLHTCVVTHKAERDVRKILGALRRDCPQLPVVVTGCGASLRRAQLERFSNVRAVIPPGQAEQVARALLGEAPAPRLDPLDPGPAMPPMDLAGAFLRLGRQRAVIKVQDGCNGRCAYCVVPMVRGPERSLAIGQVQEQVRGYLRRGHRELVLSGIHLGRYGTDLAPAESLASLLRSIGPQFGAEQAPCRLRLSSIEPLEWSDELLDTLGQSPFVCEHFHVPLQSGDDEVLRRMRRPYRVEQFRKVIEDLHRRFPDAALGTDVLVGFPDESEAAWSNSLDFLASVPLAYLHVFTFSTRPGTEAERMGEPVDARQIRTRAAAALALGRDKWLQYLDQGIGQRHQVLIEKPGPGGMVGTARTYRRVVVPGGLEPGTLVEVMAQSRSGKLLQARTLP